MEQTNICDNCGKEVYVHFIYKCEKCTSIYCKECHDSSILFRGKCSSNKCGEECCINCSSVCSNCNNSICEDCLHKKCKDCGEWLCFYCGNFCYKCDEISKNNLNFLINIFITKQTKLIPEISNIILQYYN